MGLYKQGILGSFMGKIGSVIGSSWRGIHYMRVVPAYVSNPQTPAQTMQRAKFALAFEFLKPIIAFLRISFKHAAVEMSEINAAMSHAILNAIDGEYPDFVVDPENILVSTGPLMAVSAATATAVTSAGVEVTWEDNSGTGNAQAGDIATLCVVNPEKEDIDVLMEAGVRSDGTAEIEVPESYIGDTVHVYLCFNTAEDGDWANSVFAGTVTVIT